MKALRSFVSTAVSLCVCVLGLLATVASSEAQSVVRETFSGSSTDIFSGGNFGTTNYWYIVPPDGVGDPRVQFIGYRNDKAAGSITFLTPGTNVTVQVTNSAASGTKTVIINSTNNLFVANDYVVIKYNQYNPPRYQCLQVTNVNADLKTLGLNSNLNYTISGDASLYRMVNVGGKYQVGLSTNSLSASSGGIFNGERGKPILLQMDSTTTAGLDLVSGVYGK